MATKQQMLAVRERSTRLARQLADAQGITYSGAIGGTVNVLGGTALAAVADAKLPELAGQRPSTGVAAALFTIGLVTKSGVAIRAAQGALAPMVYEAVYERMTASEQAG